MPRSTLHLALGEIGGVVQQQRQQIAARGVGVDRAAKAALHQQGQTPAVIDVRVAEDDRVDRRGVERKRLQVAARRITPSLHHAAVKQQGPPTDPQYVAGAGDLARCTEELDLHTEPRVTPTRGANLGIFCPTLGC